MTFNRKNSLHGERVYYLFIVIAGLLFYVPFLGGVHLFDWDEVNFAEISREMMVTSNFLKVQVNFLPFYEKPPLFFWIQVLSMKVFGVNEFAARFPNALVGIITLLLVFKIGTILFDRRFGLIWALAYFGSVLPFLYFKSGIIDPLFNLMIFSGLWFFIKYKWKREGSSNKTNSEKNNMELILAGLFVGLAVLTKGPVAYLIVILSIGIYWIFSRFRYFISIPKLILFSVVAGAVMLVWFGPETILHGPGFMKEFILYQIRLLSTPDAGHGGFPGFHVVVLLFGCFPASVFAIRGFYKMKPENDHQNEFRKWMIILFWVVLVLFSVVQSKIVHYSSLAYFPLTFLAALTITQIIDKKIRFNRWLKSGLLVIGLIYSVVTISIPFLALHIDLIKPLFAKDAFALATLGADVHWTGWEVLPGFLMLIILMIFFWYTRKEKFTVGIRVLFGGTAVFVLLGLVFFIGRIEMYTQDANVEFCKSLAGKEGYIVTSGMRSYIPPFYSKRMPPKNKKSHDLKWLIWEPVDEDVYIIAKVGLEDYWKSVYTCEQIGGENGFVFFKRKRE